MVAVVTFGKSEKNDIHLLQICIMIDDEITDVVMNVINSYSGEKSDVMVHLLCRIKLICINLK